MNSCDGDDCCNEIWSNNKTGRYINVYERNNLYVRAQEDNRPDMAEQKHFQMNIENFKKIYTMFGTIKEDSQ